MDEGREKESKTETGTLRNRKLHGTKLPPDHGGENHTRQKFTLTGQTDKPLLAHC